MDVPEMEYFASNGEGEVCCKGPNVFRGYLNDEAKTKETIDEDGWLHTGDIGRWTEVSAIRCQLYSSSITQPPITQTFTYPHLPSHHPLSGQKYPSTI